MSQSLNKMLLVIALLLGLIAFGLFGRRAASQSPSSTPPGRYQFAATAAADGAREYVFDTQTGRVWERANGNSWGEISPDWSKK